MTILDYAALFLLLGITLLSLNVIWQMYVVITEIHTLDTYQHYPKLLWIAAAIFFSFSLAIYYFCPNSRKKGWIFLILGALGIMCYGLGMHLKNMV